MLFSLKKKEKKNHVKNTGQPDPARNPIDLTSTRPARFAMSSLYPIELKLYKLNPTLDPSLYQEKTLKKKKM